MFTFAFLDIPVTSGNAPQSIARVRQVTLSRQLLQEDPGPSADELRGRIEIAAIGLPPPVTVGFTDQEVLPG
jgi:hypothetical protein